MKRKIQKVKVSELSPHPENEKIYGTENVQKLQNSIRSYGLQEPLVVNDKNQVVSGNNRLRAIKNLGWTEVETEQLTFDSEEDELAYLLEANTYRSKTQLQRINEGLLIEKIIKEESKERMLSTLNHGQKKDKTVARENFITQNKQDSETRGRTDEIVAQKIGMTNYKAYAKGKVVAIQINKYLENDEDDKATLLSQLVESSLDAAKKTVMNDLLDKEEFKDWKELKKRTIEYDKPDTKAYEKSINANISKNQLYDKLEEFEKLIAEIISMNEKIKWDEEVSPITQDHLAVFKLFVEIKVEKSSNKDELHNSEIEKVEQSTTHLETDLEAEEEIQSLSVDNKENQK